MTGEEFRHWRKAMGLSQTQAAALLRYTVRQIKRFDKDGCPRWVDEVCSRLMREREEA